MLWLEFSRLEKNREILQEKTRQQQPFLNHQKTNGETRRKLWVMRDHRSRRSLSPAARQAPPNPHNALGNDPYIWQLWDASPKLGEVIGQKGKCFKHLQSTKCLTPTKLCVFDDAGPKVLTKRSHGQASCNSVVSHLANLKIGNVRNLSLHSYQLPILKLSYGYNFRPKE